jgi:hypothetical protein
MVRALPVVGIVVSFSFFLLACSTQGQPFPSISPGGRIEVVNLKEVPKRTICSSGGAVASAFIQHLAETYPRDWFPPHLFVSLAPSYTVRMDPVEVDILVRGVVVRSVLGDKKIVLAHAIDDNELPRLLALACGKIR